MMTATLILPLAAIIYEDFRYRAIHWIWVALLVLLLLVFYPVNWSMVGLNLGFIAIQGVLLTLYFSIRQGQLINITRAHLGIGDLVFFLPLCLLFSPVNLILFFVIGLSLSLLGFLLFRRCSSHPVETVPLAGCLAMVLIPLLIAAIYFDLHLSNDLIWFHFLNRL